MGAEEVVGVHSDKHAEGVLVEGSSQGVIVDGMLVDE